jgi:hypothetical protein
MDIVDVQNLGAILLIFTALILIAVAIALVVHP